LVSTICFSTSVEPRSFWNTATASGSPARAAAMFGGS